VCSQHFSNTNQTLPGLSYNYSVVKEHVVHRQPKKTTCWHGSIQICYKPT